LFFFLSLGAIDPSKKRKNLPILWKEMSSSP